MQAYSTLLSKGIIDETTPNFSGLYNGSSEFAITIVPPHTYAISSLTISPVSLPGIKDAVEKHSDLVIHIGPHLSDSNTGGFTNETPDNKRIMLHPHYCSVLGERFEGIHFFPVLEKIVTAVEKDMSKYKKSQELGKYKVSRVEENSHLGRLS